MTELRVFSFGGGVQSMSVMVLAAQKRVQYDAFIFANVGEDSENPDTIDYIQNYVKPFAEAHSLNFQEVRRVRRAKGGGVETTLMKELTRAKRTVIIPMRMAGSGALGNRNCTTDFKIRVIDRWVRALPEINKESRVTVGLGISVDEYQRMRSTEWHDRETPSKPKSRKFGFWKRREYPLIEQRLSRSNAMQLISDAGLPVPPKSSCFFCPFHSKETWMDLKQNRPDLFAKAVEVERLCNSKRTDMGRDGMFLHPALKPLNEAVSNWRPQFMPDEEEDGCADGGYCMV